MDRVAAAIGETMGVGAAGCRVTMLKGDASSRSYHRVELPAGRVPRTVVVMELNADPLKSDEFTEWIPSEYPFLTVQRYLASGGLPVPAILGARPEAGWLVLEDLGDDTLESVLARQPAAGREEWYCSAVDLLARWQAWWRSSAEANPVRGRSFSRRLLEWEIAHYVEWGIEARLGRRLEGGARREIDEAFRPLVDAIERIPRVLVHRDWQSRNLMVAGDAGGGGRAGKSLGIIDFQDALMGSAVYDVVALLNDSYQAIPEDLQATASERLRLESFPGVGAEEWRTWCDLQSVQRKLKDAGRFVFIDRVKGNPSFLVHVPQSLEYVRRALQRLPAHARLGRLLGDVGGLACD